MKRNKTRSSRSIFALSVVAAMAVTPVVSPVILPQVGQASTFKNQTLQLGAANLKETREKTNLAPGVTYTHIVRGTQSQKDVYIVDVAFLNTRNEADALVQRLKSDGCEPRVEVISKRAADDPQHGPLGYLVRVGSFKTESEANKLRDDLTAKGYQNLHVVYSGEDGGNTTGPWVVNVLEINPKQFKGRITPDLGTEIIPDREKVSSIAARTHALAATNGGYFVMGPSDGTEGDLAGVSMINGDLISEAVNGRTSLILSGSGKNARIASVVTQLTAAASDGAKRDINGLNRKPGLIRDGGEPGDLPSDKPKQDFTFTNPNELIQFTSKFGQTSDPGEGVEAVLDATGVVIEFRDHRGGAIPKDGSVLAGTGNAVDWLRTHAKVGMKINVKKEVLANGSELRVNNTTGIVNGGPRLLAGGKVKIPAMAEGFNWPDNPEFFYRFGERRNPRTLAGVKADGTILLVTVDGRHPGYSVGASFEESAQIMKSLGATDALNLDGGGSTTMTIGSKLITHPSDSTGERPVGDAIVVLP
ncbi:phosphodiester glycosidase family protein [Aneurinibacillus sp. Ricciae_BoGa-3]|uniref:phosphodiester glycosidase family protein n=1 Tax=Aneurinibacillus sp. Ricciae_BoGa-3 TaxID=3022697 RepID=UPI00234197FB|nr:phosphodiester glycosidase family protein [Aneurinibacillus sp. Ricciae_BoGa-3]WCK54490.1 phosphodiester glycosidase family protein [Aneurinibacillus sp. Ricciae_BoGa-3]